MLIKKVLFCCLLCYEILFIQGCSENVTEQATESSQICISERIDENLTIDINYDSKVKNYYNVRLKKRLYADDMLNNVFFKEDNLKKDIWTDGIGKTFSNGINELRTDGNYFDFVRTAVCENYFLLVKKDNANSLGVVRTDLEEYFDKDKLTDLNYNLSKELNDNYIKELGISGTLTEHYALDTNGLNLLEKYLLPDKYYNELVEQGSLPNGRFRNWKKEQEAYVFVNQVNFDGIPIHNISYTSDGQMRAVDFGYVWCIVDEEGFISFSSGSVPGEELERSQVELISMKDASDKVILMYQNRLFTTAVCVDKVELIYVPIEDNEKEIVLIPAWRFRTTIGEKTKKTNSEQNSGNPISVEYSIINAVTGEVLS